MLKPSKVVKHFGGVAETARFFNVYPQAVYMWLWAEKDGKTLPKMREMELAMRLPDAFPYRG